MITQINSVDEFKKVVEGPAVLVDFFATWCGPCKMLHPVRESVSEKLAGKVAVAQCDIDKNADIAGAFRIQSVPTLVFFSNGKPVVATSGYMPEDALLQFIDDAQKKAA